METFLDTNAQKLLSHIGEIKEYLESNNAILPNPIVVAFKKKYVEEAFHLLKETRATMELL